MIRQGKRWDRSEDGQTRGSVYSIREVAARDVVAIWAGLSALLDLIPAYLGRWPRLVWGRAFGPAGIGTASFLLTFRPPGHF